MAVDISKEVHFFLRITYFIKLQSKKVYIQRHTVYGGQEDVNHLRKFEYVYVRQIM